MWNQNANWPQLYNTGSQRPSAAPAQQSLDEWTRWQQDFQNWEKQYGEKFKEQQRSLTSQMIVPFAGGFQPPLPSQPPLPLQLPPAQPPLPPGQPPPLPSTPQQPQLQPQPASSSHQIKNPPMLYNVNQSQQYQSQKNQHIYSNSTSSNRQQFDPNRNSSFNNSNMGHEAAPYTNQINSSYQRNYHQQNSQPFQSKTPNQFHNTNISEYEIKKADTSVSKLDSSVYRNNNQQSISEEFAQYSKHQNQLKFQQQQQQQHNQHQSWQHSSQPNQQPAWHNNSQQHQQNDKFTWQKNGSKNQSNFQFRNQQQQQQQQQNAPRAVNNYQQYPARNQKQNQQNNNNQYGGRNQQQSFATNPQQTVANNAFNSQQSSVSYEVSRSKPSSFENRPKNEKTVSAPPALDCDEIKQNEQKFTDLKTKQRKINEVLREHDKNYFDFKIIAKNQPDFAAKSGEWNEKRQEILKEKKEIDNQVQSLKKILDNSKIAAMKTDAKKESEKLQASTQNKGPETVEKVEEKDSATEKVVATSFNSSDLQNLFNHDSSANKTIPGLDVTTPVPASAAEAAFKTNPNVATENPPASTELEVIDLSDDECAKKTTKDEESKSPADHNAPQSRNSLVQQNSVYTKVNQNGTKKPPQSQNVQQSQPKCVPNAPVVDRSHKAIDRPQFQSQNHQIHTRSPTLNNAASSDDWTDDPMPPTCYKPRQTSFRPTNQNSSQQMTSAPTHHTAQQFQHQTNSNSHRPPPLQSPSNPTQFSRPPPSLNSFNANMRSSQTNNYSNNFPSSSQSNNQHNSRLQSSFSAQQQQTTNCQVTNNSLSQEIAHLLNDEKLLGLISQMTQGNKSSSKDSGTFENIGYRRQDLQQMNEAEQQIPTKKDYFSPVAVIDYDHKPSYLKQHIINSVQIFMYNHSRVNALEPTLGKSIYESNTSKTLMENIYQTALKSADQEEFNLPYLGVNTTNAKNPNQMVNISWQAPIKAVDQTNFYAPKIPVATREKLDVNKYRKRSLSPSPLPPASILVPQKARYDDGPGPWVEEVPTDYCGLKKPNISFAKFDDSVRDTSMNCDNFRSNARPARVVMLNDILDSPGRKTRPLRIVLILRGPPGSGKSYLAKTIKDSEAKKQNSTPRILALDDYFEMDHDACKFDKNIIRQYEASLFRSFQKTVREGFFPFIIVDCVNDRVSKFADMVNFAKNNGFQVYICQLPMDLNVCLTRNIHKKPKHEIESLIRFWEPTPVDFVTVDASKYLKEQPQTAKHSSPSLSSSSSSKEPKSNSHYQYEPTVDFFSKNPNTSPDTHLSKWELMDMTEDNLAQLDDTKMKKTKVKSMEDFLTLDDEDLELFGESDKSGKKRVKWADLEEKRKVKKMREVGFVVGQTDWNRMMDTSDGKHMLTKTKYIERIPRKFI